MTRLQMTLGQPDTSLLLLSSWSSFVWLNHHDIFASLEKINRRLLLSNGVLLFVVSLVPFATAFASESHWTAPLPVVAYGMVMVAVSLAFVRLRIIASQSTIDVQV